MRGEWVRVRKHDVRLFLLGLSIRKVFYERASAVQRPATGPLSTSKYCGMINCSVN